MAIVTRLGEPRGPGRPARDDVSLTLRPHLALALLLGSLLCPVALGLLASTARAASAPARKQASDAAALLPWADLSVASGARHLRFLSLEEPWAAFSDGPASLDSDPSGGCVAPPRQVWAGQP